MRQPLFLSVTNDFECCCFGEFGITECEFTDILEQRHIAVEFVDIALYSCSCVGIIIFVKEKLGTNLVVFLKNKNLFYILDS